MSFSVCCLFFPFFLHRVFLFFVVAIRCMFVLGSVYVQFRENGRKISCFSRENGKMEKLNKFWVLFWSALRNVEGGTLHCACFTIMIISLMLLLFIDFVVLGSLSQTHNQAHTHTHQSTYKFTQILWGGFFFQWFFSCFCHKMSGFALNLISPKKEGKKNTHKTQ